MIEDMKYNFDEIVPRKHTDCLKYDNVMEIFGTEEILPMWIADMDFKSSPAITEALKRTADHGIYGYGEIDEEYKQISSGVPPFCKSLQDFLRL